LVGRAAGDIDKCYATGKVTGSKQVGGLLGYNDLSVSNSYATGDVTGNGDYYVGGLIGLDWGGGKKVNNYATGNVKGSGDYVGGFAGDLRGESSDNYATGNDMVVISVKVMQRERFLEKAIM